MPTRSWVSHHKIADHLRARIKQGALTRGDKLPSFKQLNRQFGVATATVSKALDMLEGDGLVERRPGSGIYVAGAESRRRRMRIALTGTPPVQETVSDYWSRFIGGVQSAGQTSGAEVALVSAGIDMQWDDYDGHLALSESSLHASSSRPQSIPAVAVCYLVPGVPCVAVNEYEAGYIAAKHLISLGHRNIGYINWPIAPASVLRLTGYQTAMYESGMTPDPELLRYMLHASGANGLTAIGASTMTHWLANGFSESGCTAIIAQNDFAAYGIIDSLVKAGYRVPEDISVIGFDNERESLMRVPQLTSVSADMFELGARAVRMLVRLMQGETEPNTATLLPVQLTVRATTGPARGGEGGSPQASTTNPAFIDDRTAEPRAVSAT